MLFVAVTVVLGVLIYMFVQRVVVMKPIGIAGIDEAIDALIERQKKREGEGKSRRRKGGRKARSWESASLSEHTMDLIDSLEATTCPTDNETRSSAAATTRTAVSMGSQASKEASSALEFDKTFSPKDAAAASAAAKQEETGVKKAHRHHHHKRHHRHRSREGERERERSSENSEEGESGGGEEEDGKKSKGGGHKRHRKHRSRDVVPGPRLDAPLLVAGETLPGPDAVDVEMRTLEAIKSP